jgi:hypothetical protein
MTLESPEYSYSPSGNEQDDDVLRPEKVEEPLFTPPTTSFESDLTGLAKILDNVGTNFEKVKDLGEVRGHA